MASLKYYYIINTPGPKVWTMPKGFQSNVEIHLWGAGGGLGSSQPGGGGAYVSTTATVDAGDIVEIGVGQKGAAASGASAGVGGGSTIGFKYSGGPGGAGTGDEDGENGGGGGGGGATVVLIDGNVVAVAAGGGGGGGYGDDYAAGSAGLPGGVYVRL